VIAISVLGLLAHALVPVEILSGITDEWHRHSRDGAQRDALIDGRLAAAVDTTFEELHPFRAVAVPVVAALRYGLFRQGNDGVIVGRGGRLFTVEEVAWYREDASRLEDRLRYIGAIDQRLAAAGVDLFVLLVPAKARIDTDHLPLRLRESADHPRLRHARDELRRRGIPVVDGAAVLEGERFFARDTHWTPEGAGVVAAAIALTVSPTMPAETEFELLEEPEQLLPGDLMNFVPVGGFNDLFGLTPEPFRPVVAVAAADASAGTDLFATPEIPVALVGTSYSADRRWGFVDQLRKHLGVDVLEMSEAGSGPFVPMERYLMSETFEEIPPRAIIWEIPERYLTLPDTPFPGDAPSDGA
jgi:alginate O-acetyltransferase complex protein AlgJ